MHLFAILIVGFLFTAKCEAGAKSKIEITRAKEHFPESPEKFASEDYATYQVPYFQFENSQNIYQTSVTNSKTNDDTTRQSVNNVAKYDHPKQARANIFPTLPPVTKDNLHHETSIDPVISTPRKVTIHQQVPIIESVEYGSTKTGEDLLENAWRSFKLVYNKSYPSYEEDRHRRDIFIENRNKIGRFNIEYGNGRHTFVLKINQYGDLLNQEFSRYLNGFTPAGNDTHSPKRHHSSYIEAANVGFPTHVDWREVGAVSRVKSQGMCGGCYAFAAAGAIEGQVFRKTGKLVELSPQNLIDCTKSYSNRGCIGGTTDYAYEYVKDNKGIDKEEFYPYEATDEKECRYKHEGYGAHNTGYVVLDEGDEKGLEAAVATLGPVAVAIDAHPDSFQFYSSGIYYEAQCTTDNLNHAVLVVGYGTEANGEKYWLVKNSYGPNWGIGGYMKLPKFYNNKCGIASYASYPLV